MSKTTTPEKHASHESKDHGCGCGGAHKQNKPTPVQKENVARADDSKSEATQEYDKHSGCCGGGKAGK